MRRSRSTACGQWVKNYKGHKFRCHALPICFGSDMQLVRQKTRRKVLRKGYINMTCFANTVFQCLFGFWVASSKDSCSTSTCGIVMILKPFPAQIRVSSAQAQQSWVASWPSFSWFWYWPSQGHRQIEALTESLQSCGNEIMSTKTVMPKNVVCCGRTRDAQASRKLGTREVLFQTTPTWWHARKLWQLGGEIILTNRRRAGKMFDGR